YALTWPWLAGWVGFLGMLLLLHFGSFHVLALFWQRRGVAAQPIMRSVLLARSPADFWGRRWNMGFHALMHDHVFRPLRHRLSIPGCTFISFTVSGIIHDLVISLPARGGYGLPTLYFLLQGLAVLGGRSGLGRRLRLDRGWRGW